MGITPCSEKTRYVFAKYLDSVMETKISSIIANSLNENRIDDDEMRQWALANDPKSRRYLIDAIRQYLEALVYGDKHLLQSLPRVLTIWFLITSIDDAKVESDNAEAITDLLESQKKANNLMLEFRSKIPSYSYYTALPQLISRINHRNMDTAKLVKKILIRVLTKFPEQAMWPLAWILHSSNSERAAIGQEIFNSAEKHHAQQDNVLKRDLLSSCKSLFRFLIDLAKYKPKVSPLL